MNYKTAEFKLSNDDNLLAKENVSTIAKSKK